MNPRFAPRGACGEEGGVQARGGGTGVNCSRLYHRVSQVNEKPGRQEGRVPLHSQGELPSGGGIHLMWGVRVAFCTQGTAQSKAQRCELCHPQA